MNDSLPQTVMKHKSRFTEHFDVILSPEAFQPFMFTPMETTDNYDLVPSLQEKSQQRSMSISTPRTPTFAKPVRMHSSPALTTGLKKTQDGTDSGDPPLDTVGLAVTTSTMTMNTATTTTVASTNDNDNDNDTNDRLPALIPSASQQVIKARKQLQQQQTHVAVLYKDYASTNSTALNRADIMIKRLSNWIVFLKLAAGWLEEIAKMTASNSFKKQKKENPVLYDYISKKRKEYQHTTSNFKKECRERIQTLKSNPALQMEELLLRADETRKRMAHLSKLCEYADDPKRPHSPEMDPWLGNLQVLRYLKREINEENRLRELMVPIQREMKELETRLMASLTDLVEFCIQQQTTVAQYGTTMDQVLSHFLPQHTWQAFMNAQHKELVDEDHIKKNHTQINYPNKQHTHVATVQKGLLGRRTGVLKQYHNKFYVLTHYGYLHQFKLDDKVKPESSIYVAGTTIQPSVHDDDVHFDERGMAEEMDNYTGNHQHNGEKGGAHTFEIHHKRKTYYFKTTTGAELISWCRALTNVANGSSVGKLLEKRRQRQAQGPWRKQQDNNSSIASTSTVQQPQQPQQQWQQQQQQLARPPLQDPQQVKEQEHNYYAESDHHYQYPHGSQEAHHHSQGRNDSHETEHDDEDDDDVSHFQSIHSSSEDSNSLLYPTLTEIDIVSLDVPDSGSVIITSPSSITIPSQPISSILGEHEFKSHLTASPPAKSALSEDESAIYFSSTSSPSSPSSSSSTGMPAMTSSHILPSPSATPAVVPSISSALPSSPLSPAPLPSISSRRAIPTYQANLNMMAPASIDHPN